MNKTDFPIFNSTDLAYLDNASTTQKPSVVINDMNEYYSKYNANTSRGAYGLAIKATNLFENSRSTVKKFINAKSEQEIIFTKGTTEAINLIAYSYAFENIKADDEIALLISEHHANLLPWQNVCKQKRAKLTYLYFNDRFEITEEEINLKINSKTKIVACAIVSNALGIVNPVKALIKKAREVGAIVVVDAAQAVSHIPIDVIKLDCDFLVFSAHKMYGPMGVGILYGKKEILNKMSPFLFGGEMVEYAYEDSVTLNGLPYKFEGGTQNVGGAIGLSSAIKYIEDVGFDKINNHITTIFNYTIKNLKKLDYINIIGDKNNSRTSIISFLVDGVHPHDLSSILDSENVCIRAGNHCAQPLLRSLNINSTARASIALYNTKEDIDKLIKSIIIAKGLFENEH